VIADHQYEIGSKDFYSGPLKVKFEMLAIKKILVAITPAVPFGRIMLQAAWLARRCGAELILLHVGSHVWDIADQAPDGLMVTRLSFPGDPVNKIVATARERGADLIVMATHEKWRVGDGSQAERDFLSFVRQSVVARVIDAAPCPVWADTGRDMANDGFHKPLCYLDLKARSAGTLAQASLFAGAMGTRLTVAHATFRTQIYAPGGASPVAGMWKESFAQTATEKFAQLQREVGTDADIVVENGEPLDVLPRLASRTQADLLMIGHWTRSEQWDDESDVLRTIRYSRVPVLIFKDVPTAAPQQDTLMDSRRRLIRNIVILLPVCIFLIMIGILTIEKNRPALLPADHWWHSHYQ
jgi:nucleotide-binding universal stress UspA family protein